MATTVKCNNCGHEFEITEAIRKELEEQVLNENNKKHEEEIKKLQASQKEMIAKKEKELEEEKEKISKSAREEAIEKVRKEYNAKIESTKEEAEEREKQNKELQEELTKIMKELRESKNAESKLKIEFEKKMLEEQDKIKQEALKEAAEENKLKNLEKEKKLNDAEKQIAELQRKLKQGSQQLQGEVQELELEETLAREFPFDEIKEVPKGIRGADVIQIVKTNSGKACGMIVWESKNTKSFTNSWISKLKEDQRALKGDIGIIVTKAMPEGVEGFGMQDGVWISDMKSALNLGFALRQQLLKLNSVRIANAGKASKAEVVYNYLISNEFKQRIEVWVEYFQDKREELEKEKRYFMKKWEKEEKSMMKLMQTTTGIYGDLQGLIGNALPKVSYLELPDIDEDNDKDEQLML